jgi:hypothetical protein
MNKNPFEFEAAIRFTTDEMVDYFIDDHNFARFIHSQRNVFLLGDRGTGKTMMLRYYSLPVQVCRHNRETPNADLSDCLELIGVYIPCRNTVLAKPEPGLLEPLLGRLMSEHLVIVAVVNALAEALLAVPRLVDPSEDKDLRSEIEFILQWKLPRAASICEALKAVAMREAVAIQGSLNKRHPDSYYENAVTFSTAVLPLIHLFTTHIAKLGNSHFSLMFDDAEALTDMQNAALNTWIASRDNPRISFKVATSLVDQKTLLTSAGGELLERHDFIRLDMEQDFQSTEASFHKLAEEIVERRLAKVNIDRSVDEFFPLNPQMATDLQAAAAAAKRDAAKSPNATAKQIRDYVYKYGRAYYFRSRSPTANRPPYSGFDLIVHVSTGVIRYLLEPCYEMYDEAISRLESASAKIKQITPAIQTERLEALSKRRWDWIRQGFNNSVRGCTREDAKHIAQLLDNLAILLTHRLHHHKSEPRAITFSISAKESFSKTQSVLNLLEIARRAQILFKRTSSGKDDGKREDYYTFDRLLWIDRGLDPVGQNACVSIEARFLWEAAFANRPFPTGPRAKKGRPNVLPEQPEMFKTQDT